MRVTRALRRSAVLTVTALVAALAGVQLPASAQDSDRIDTSNRTEVIQAYTSRMLPELTRRLSWSGSLTSRDPGGANTAEEQSTLRAVNWARAMVGVEPATLDAEKSEKARAAALMMAANDDLDHSPPASWKCYTQEGDSGAGSSNLAIGWGMQMAGGQAIDTYLDDDGENNTEAGHRWWILRPGTASIGSGAAITDDVSAHALYVFQSTTVDHTDAPEWISWPTAGYFPAEQEPNGRWSLLSTDPDVSFEDATVSMTGPDGNAVSITTPDVTTSPDGDRITWDLRSAVKQPVWSQDVTYHVTVSGLREEDGEARPDYSYSVTLVDAVPDPVSTSTSVSLSRTTGAATAPATATVRVTGPSGTTPTGKVTVHYGSKQKSVTLSASQRGTTTLKLPRMKPGTVKVWAEFEGSDLFLDSFSGDKKLKVVKASSRVTAKLEKRRISRSKRGKVTVTVRGMSDPTGKVRVKVGKKSKVVTLSKKHHGKVTATLPKLKKGKHKVTVKFLGNTYLQAKTASSKKLTITVR